MKIAYGLCGYDRTTERLAVEYPVPVDLLPLVRRLIEPVSDDHYLALAYELTPPGVQTLAAALGLPIDPDRCHYYFEASGVADASVAPAIATD